MVCSGHWCSPPKIPIAPDITEILSKVALNTLILMLTPHNIPWN